MRDIGATASKGEWIGALIGSFAHFIRGESSRMEKGIVDNIFHSLKWKYPICVCVKSGKEQWETEDIPIDETRESELWMERAKREDTMLLAGPTFTANQNHQIQVCVFMKNIKNILQRHQILHLANSLSNSFSGKILMHYIEKDTPIPSLPSPVSSPPSLPIQHINTQESSNLMGLSRGSAAVSGKEFDESVSRFLTPSSEKLMHIYFDGDTNELLASPIANESERDSDIESTIKEMGCGIYLLKRRDGEVHFLMNVRDIYSARLRTKYLIHKNNILCLLKRHYHLPISPISVDMRKDSHKLDEILMSLRDRKNHENASKNQFLIKNKKYTRDCEQDANETYFNRLYQKFILQ